MSCTTIKVTVVGSPSGVLSIMKAASQAVKDAESARDESFLSRDAAKTSASESSDSARKAQASASDSAQSALKAKESEGTAQGFADDAQTSMVGAKGAMAQAKVYRDQAKQFAGQRLPVDVKHDGKTVGVGLLAIDFVGSGVDVVSTGEQQYKVTITDTGSLVTWASLSGKPSTFPPATHQHTIAQVTELQTALDGKQPKGSYATTAQLGAKLDAATYTAEKAKFARTDQPNAFAQKVTLSVDGVDDTDAANVKTVKALIAAQAAKQTTADEKLRARVLSLEDESAAKLNVTANDADKTITVSLIEGGKTVSSGTVDISGMFTTPSQPAQSIPFTRHYLGAAHATIAALVSKDIPTQEGKAGEAYTLADGWGASNRTKLTLGISGGAIVVSSVSSEMADFTIHKIFSAEDTVLMRGKEERVTVTTENRDCAFILLGMKWTGKPDEATTEILVNRNNGSPVFAPDWAEFDREFISENALTDSTVSHVFTVPPDATQYAYVLIPNAEQNPITLKIKQFVCDVVNPFEAHIVHRPKLIETMMRKQDEFWEFAQDNQGYFSLRYTVNAVWIPCPIGLLKKGSSLLKLDASKMVIAGSAAKGGEGAIVFPDAGKVTMAVSFFALNEQATDSEFSARLVKVADSGAVTPIAGADLRVKISANSKGSIVNLKADTFDVSAGDCVGIQVKSDKVDGCFLESTTPSQPLVLTTIEYLRVV